MELSKKSETATKITFEYEGEPEGTEGYRYYADGVPVSRTFNPDDHEVTFGKIPSGKYSVEALGFTSLARAEWPVVEPTPVGNKLRWKPPGWNGNEPTLPSSYPGYQVKSVTKDGTVSLTNGVDYVLEVDASYSGGGRIWVQGGRNIVVVGGEIDYANSSGDGFNSSFQFEGGDDGAIVHVEGFLTKNQPNGFTLKAPKMFQFQNIHCDLRDGSGQGHPDLIQVWSGYKAKGIRINRWTGYSGYTYFSDFTDDKGPAQFGSETPGFWELYDVDMHHVNGQGLGNWMGSPNHAVWKGKNLWLETSTEPTGNRRDMGDQLRQYGLQYPPTSPPGYGAQYQIFDTDGTTLLYTSPVNPQGGAPGDIGRLQGQYLRYINNPRLTAEWRCQKAPVSAGADANGNFVPAATVGPNYRSPGYV
jgi:hypothetical protein